MIESYKQFIARGDEGALITKISSMFGKSHYHFAVDTLSVPRLQGADLYKDKKYPSPKNMRRLFDRLGIPQIFVELNKSSKRDLESVLTSFNDVRTEIAHSGIPPAINDRDIKIQIANMQSFIYHLDKTFYKHVCKHTGVVSWAV